ncbi:hypothetical protein DENSPDRAFT_883717 [Dentipellis sp. KUC8613]|nr:hypothetical protein DENSPDRAFT_883717 [Dentipellis sp. KUC8613]
MDLRQEELTGFSPTLASESTASMRTIIVLLALAVSAVAMPVANEQVVSRDIKEARAAPLLAPFVEGWGITQDTTPFQPGDE